MVHHLAATGRHLPYGITQCYLPPAQANASRLNPSHAGWYSIYLPRRDGRLSWPSWLDSAPAGSRTSDLSIDESDAEPLHHQVNNDLATFNYYSRGNAGEYVNTYVTNVCFRWSVLWQGFSGKPYKKGFTLNPRKPIWNPIVEGFTVNL